MLSRFLPREVGFFDFFEQHIQVVVEGARVFRALLSVEESKIMSTARGIKAIEHKADEIAHTCMEALHKTFITPIDRVHIHELICALDDIIDLIDGAARRLVLYEIYTIPQPLREITEILVRATESLQRGVIGLRHMKNARTILDECIHVNGFENEADALYAAAMKTLFKTEKDAITIMKWKEIYESLESATDACEDVANILEGIVLEHA